MNLKKYNNPVILFLVIGFITVAITGTLAHFIFDWSGRNQIIGLFTAVNESTWEHMKLLFFPMLIYTFISGYFFRKTIPSRTFALLIGTLAGTIMIPVLFYTYTGILGFMVTPINLGIYYVSVLIAFLIAGYIIFNSNCKSTGILLLIIITILCCMFFLFTYSPPDLGIFIDPTK